MGSWKVDKPSKQFERDGLGSMQLLDNVYGTLRSFAFMRPVKSSNDTSLADALQADTDMAFILVRGINYQ